MTAGVLVWHLSPPPIGKPPKSLKLANRTYMVDVVLISPLAKLPVVWPTCSNATSGVTGRKPSTDIWPTDLSSARSPLIAPVTPSTATLMEPLIGTVPLAALITEVPASASL